MSLFQWIGVPLLLLLLVTTIAAALRRRVTPRVGLGWSVVWIMAATAILQPGLTGDVARLVGIGRGADLVLYCAILAMMVGFFMMYVRYRKVEEEITTIVRHLAIDRKENAGTTLEPRRTAQD